MVFEEARLDFIVRLANVTVPEALTLSLTYTPTPTPSNLNPNP